MKTIMAAAAAAALVTGPGLVMVLAAGPAWAAPGTLPAAAPMSGPASAPAERPVVYDCAGWRHGQAKIRQIEITCDANVLVTMKGWKYWTGRSARSRGGKLWVNTCQPDCAAGHYRKYASTVVCYRVRSHHGVRYFSRMRLTYRHGRLRSYVYRWARYPGGSQPVWVGGP